MLQGLSFSLLLLASFYTESVNGRNSSNASHQPSHVASENLKRYLFTDYVPALMPKCSVGGNVTLDLDLALRQIMELNEKEQILTCNVWIRTRWHDCRLTWDPADYDNQTTITVPYNEAWTPDLTLFDSAAEEVMFPGQHDYNVRIYNNGLITYNFPTVVKSICLINIRLFPFDTQVCPLQFGSWIHNGLELDIVHRYHPDVGDLDHYIENLEWHIENLPVKRHVLIYNCCPEPYPDITFYITMHRHPAFYILTMLFPSFLTSCVAALSFLLPVESGEKIELQITVLLSQAVFLLLVTESLPPSSENIPLIGSFFACSMVLVSLSLLQTVLVINVFYRGTNSRRVPGWLKVVCLQYMGRYLLMYSNNMEIHSDQDNFMSLESLDTKVSEQATVTGNTVSEQPTVTGNTVSEQTTVTGNTVSEQPTVTGNTDKVDGAHVDGTYVDGKDVTSSQENIKHNSEVHTSSGGDPMVKCLKQQTEHLENIWGHVASTEHKEKINSEWRDISNVLDRFCLFMYMLVLIGTTLTFTLVAIIKPDVHTHGIQQH